MSARCAVAEHGHRKPISVIPHLTDAAVHRPLLPVQHGGRMFKAALQTSSRSRPLSVPTLFALGAHLGPCCTDSARRADEALSHPWRRVLSASRALHTGMRSGTRVRTWWTLLTSSSHRFILASILACRALQALYTIGEISSATIHALMRSSFVLKKAGTTPCARCFSSFVGKGPQRTFSACAKSKNNFFSLTAAGPRRRILIPAHPVRHR
mmetsp:Transcript_54135/g.144170  ORF Transcript_54135/g.144170 Transcript_54135/m.144170 type:complete len:211 (-) Transcript_54135:1573-2205(-)